VASLEMTGLLGRTLRGGLNHRSGREGKGISMTPGARVAATIELLDEIVSRPERPSDGIANASFRARRFSGGGNVGPVSLGWKGGVGDHVGYVLLVGLATIAGATGLVLVAIRDADPAAQAELLGLDSVPAGRRVASPAAAVVERGLAGVQRLEDDSRRCIALPFCIQECTSARRVPSCATHSG